MLLKVANSIMIVFVGKTAVVLFSLRVQMSCVKPVIRFYSIPTDFRALFTPNVYLSLQIPLMECGSQEKCITDLSLRAVTSVKTCVFYEHVKEKVKVSVETERFEVIYPK